MISFIGAVFLLIITPGPGVLSTAGVGAAFGFRAGFAYVLGLFIGTNLVALAVVTGVAAVVLASPVIRSVLFVLSTGYLLYMAAKIALAGTKTAFEPAARCPNVWDGIALQAVNPKAYVVNTTLFSGFVIFQDALLTEMIFKFVAVNAIWIPIHLGWLWVGGALKRMELPKATQRLINVAMAVALVLVVVLAAAAQFL
ncbi:LysE family translocator [Algirhabdus cladophorae]|uniref:LysE family translocator n=1 Tax=Algirhabdus cladophorae TaxID=3377108 RepID=UPI003B846EA3